MKAIIGVLILAGSGVLSAVAAEPTIVTEEFMVPTKDAAIQQPGR